MANYEKHGATGQMSLAQSWEESSSTHIESLDEYKLVATEDEKSVVLIHSSGTKNFIKSSANDSQETKTQISAEELIKLILQHGKKL